MIWRTRRRSRNLSPTHRGAVETGDARDVEHARRPLDVELHELEQSGSAREQPGVRLGGLLRAGTAVDATLIAAPSSTKNAEGERDPDMHQVKKGNQWYIGIKAHIGLDAQSGVVHTVVGTAANVSDIKVAGTLLHGEEQVAFGDAGYQGVHKRAEAQGPTWHVAMRQPNAGALTRSSRRSSRPSGWRE